MNRMKKELYILDPVQNSDNNIIIKHYLFFSFFLNRIAYTSIYSITVNKEHTYLGSLKIELYLGFFEEKNFKP